MTRVTANFVFVSLLLALLIAGATPIAAQSNAQAAPATGFRAGFLRHWDDLQKKFVGLAQAIPQEKFTWRPGEGVRSVSEVFLHVAGANIAFMAALGVEPPAGIDRRNFERSTADQAKVVEHLKQSFEVVRQTLLQTPDAHLEKPAKLFGRETTAREVFFRLATHQPEHLGQVIAYARVNNIVPPWTAERQARQQREQQKPKE